MNSVCICGAGTMGRGIAQVSSAAGFRTILFDVNEGALQNAGSRLQRDLQMLVDRGKLTSAEGKSVLEGIEMTGDIAQCRADLVIEAVVEKPDVKISLFNRLAEINAAETIYASNTSSLSISAIAAGTRVAGQVAGLHFFNPAPVMKLVEVVQGEKTREDVITALVEFTRRCGKTPVICRDAPGFIVNRVARPFYIESLRIAEQGLADFDTIDSLLEAAGFRMGPFRLMDLIGNDVNYAVSCSVYEQLGKPERLRPSFIQKEKVDSNELGKKTGRGYYSYQT